MVPGEIDLKFLKGFKNLILKHLKRFKNVIIVTGGGYTCRQYQKAAGAISKLTDEDMDWLGIHASRLNGHLLRTIFRKQAHPVMITTPNQREKFRKKVVIAAGWRPGWSTDYVATVLARTYGVKTILNLSNIKYVYDKDPKKYRDAKKLAEISWKDFRRMVGNKWTPGGNFPFDPIASQLAQRLDLEVYVMDGSDLKNLDRFLMGENFEGTRISG